MSLTEKIGQKNAPGTLVGNLESRIKQLEASGEELSKLKGKTYDEFMKDITQGQKAMRKLEDEGLVRAAAREIINKDIKSGKIKLPKEIEQDMVQGGGEPINVLRQFYGEGALEQLDSMIPEFKKMYSPKEAADAATKKFKFEFKADRPPGSTSIEDAKKTQVTDLKTEATKRKSVDDLIDEYNANQDRLRLSDKEGGTLIGYEEYEQLRKRNKDIAKALEDKGISSKVEKKPEAEIIPFTNKPDPEDFATGGRVGYAKGGFLKLAMKFFNDNNPVSAYKKYLKYVKETAQKDPAKLAPEVGGIVVGSELIHRGLRRKLKEVKEKNNENDSENLERDNRTEKAGGGVSQGLDYLTGIERRGYVGGGRIGFKKGSFLINTAIDAAKNLSKKKSKKELKRQLTDDEIDDLVADVGDLDAYLDFDGTVGSAEKIRKQHKEYMDYMYYQYKTGRLDPKPGEMNTSRMQYLRNKRKEAEMTDDPKLFNPNERDELDNLEETFSPMGTSNKINISDPKTAESFTEFAKQNDPEGFKKIQKIVDDINNKNTLENFDITGRKKNAGGGLNYLMGL
jgi:DNA-directed RNA polymerase subunit N (RpoN/RPB10)